MKIIYVQGVGGSGKTSSIRRFLTNRKVIFEYIGDKQDVSVMLPMLINGLMKDVAICSNGDAASDVEGHLRWAQNNGADILVCACRSRGGTIDALKGFAQAGSHPTYPIQCVREDPQNQAAADQKIAHQIETLL